MKNSEAFNAEQAKRTEYIRSLANDRLKFRSEPRHMQSFVREASTNTIWGLPEATIFINMLNYIRIKNSKGKSESSSIRQLDDECRITQNNLFDFGKKEDVPMNIKDYLIHRVKIAHNGFDIMKEVPGFLDYCMKRIVSEWSSWSSMNSEANVVSQIFANLTENQKKSVINLLSLIASSDEGDDGFINEKEIEFISIYGETFDLTDAICIDYLDLIGATGTINDLKALTLIQKDCLLDIVIKLIICDKKPTDIEIEAALAVLYPLGIDEDKFVSSFNKIMAIMKKSL